MKTKVYKDVIKYQSTIAGLTYRQLISIIGMVIFTVICIVVCQNILYIFDSSKIILYSAIISCPIGLYGFFSYEGETFEILAKNLFKFARRMRFTIDGE